MKEKTSDNFIEIVEVDRRQFLRIAGGALISLSSLGLIGCGGSGNGTASSGTQLAQTSGTVQLPSGTKLSATTLTVESNNGSSKISTGGGFTAGTVGVPTLAYVVNSAGNVILMGFVDPQAKTNTLSATSTAIALLYFSLDGYMIPGDSARTVLTLIQESPATAIFAQTISSRIVANSLALDSSDAQLTAALRTAYNSIVGVKTAMSHGVSKAPTTATTTNALVEITGGTQSGFEVNQDAANEAFIGTNNYRRWCRLYLYETGTVDSTGTVNNYAAAKLVGAPISVPSTERLNLFTSIAAIFASTSPFSPVNTSSVPVSLETNTTQTLYDVVVLGSSGILVDPVFFSDPIYSGQLATWRADQGTLNLQSAVIDILFGMALNILGVGGLSTFGDTSIAAALKDLEAFGDAAWQSAIVDAISGKAITSITFRAGAYLLGSSGVTISSTKAFLTAFWNAFDSLEAGASAAKTVAIDEARFGVLLRWGFKVVLGAITGASVVLGATDLGAVLKDFGASNKGDIWNVLVTLPTVHLTPNAVSITPGVSQPPVFTAAPSAGVTGTITWTWTLTGAVSAKLSDGTSQGTTLKTTDASITLLTTPLDINNMVVAVQGFINGVSIGTAKSTVKIVPLTQIAVTAVAYEFPFSSFEGSKSIVVGFATFTPVSNADYYEYPVEGVQGTGTVYQSAIAAGGVAPLVPGTTNFASTVPQYGGNSNCYNVGGKPGFGTPGYVPGDGQTIAQLIAQVEAQLVGTKVTVGYA